MATPKRCEAARFEFHVARAARDRYGFDDQLFALSGNVVFADFRAARVFAQRMNEGRDLAAFPEQAVSAGQVNAMGLVDEILHLLLARHRQDRRPGLMAEIHRAVEHEVGAAGIDELLLAFVEEFPPVAVYRGLIGARQYLDGATGGTPHREVVLEELILLWLANLNPAFAPFRELFDDSGLRGRTAYGAATRVLERVLGGQSDLGWGYSSLLEMLRAPALAAPDSLEAQLEFLRTSWGRLLGAELTRLLGSLDLIAEETKPFFGFGPGPQLVPDYHDLPEAPEAYSADLHWMPRLVMIAKNAFVWLDQLSTAHRRPVRRLDEVPDAELDRLASWGITGLWLIGLWQRSKASQRIKQRMGNPEAVASAYSLDDYRVADELGGEAAFEDLKQRAWQRGIRMASDMVPNHMGIDSRWVIEHPDWFLGLDHSPFPTYSFGGEDLCDDERVGVYLEDHYWQRSDAAVVFQRRDHYTGSERFIYHGNDGTSMPWNDTAQLDYRRPEVREAVIRTILAVARRSPIIRFDAAMTLTKQHYQRLWFPEPGTGGDIPSRADFAMTRRDFDQVMPEEFWREVVDRVAAEAPDTLLLAEAFWLLEGYFVRSLGMHRVYNSAFMNMLRDEKNAEYRQLIRNTLEFDPQILKRYVNFMSNPDERTAVDQFGRDDKYFGVCTMMATTPGLPMFGHGQVEGFAEKYGMEYRRAYWDEQPDQELVARHQRQVFGLLHRRALFADVEAFRLYDFELHDGTVDENVFTYSNSHQGEAALVLFHNRFSETSGWIRTSTGVALKDAAGDKHLVRTPLAEGLGLPDDESDFVVLPDMVAGLEYIRSCREMHREGLYAELHAYHLQVFVDLRVVRDDDGRYARIADHLAGRGVRSIEEAMAELELAPVLEPFRALVAPQALQRLGELPSPAAEAGTGSELLHQVTADLDDLVQAIAGFTQVDVEVPGLAVQARSRLEAVASMLERARHVRPRSAAASRLAEVDTTEPEVWAPLMTWALLCDLGTIADRERPAELVVRWLDRWLFGATLASSLRALGVREPAARRAVTLVKVLVLARGWHRVTSDESPAAEQVLRRLLAEPEVHELLAVNRFDGVSWFHKESFAELLWWLLVLAAVEPGTEGGPGLEEAYEIIVELEHAEARSGYRVDKLLDAVNPARSSGSGSGREGDEEKQDHGTHRDTHHR